MSYGSEHPEKFDEMTRQGIVRYLYKALGFGSMPVRDDCVVLLTLIALSEVLQGDENLAEAYNNIRRLARPEIEEVEREYFAKECDRQLAPPNEA